MALWLGLLVMMTGGQVAEAPPRPEVAVVVVTLDDARQGQIKHGRGLLDVLGDERFGRYRLVEPVVPAEPFRHCEDDHPDYGLNFCARFYLHQEWREGMPATVVVVFDDRDARKPGTAHADEMRVLCYGRGAVAADLAAQSTWLWPGSFRIHGVRDWERDQAALAACIDAALSEEPGTPRPDPIP